MSLCIGVSGHRELDDAAQDVASTALASLLSAIRSAAQRIVSREHSFYTKGALHLSLLSQLAAGVDQIAANAAVDAGIALRAVLPFPAVEYRTDFDPAARPAFDALLDRCEARWCLPGNRAQAGLAYALAGEATAAQCDLLIAVWDGLPARGLGGTADVVDYAVRRGVPVLHQPTDGSAAAILWSGFDELPPSLFHRDNVPRRPLDDGAVDDLLRRFAEPWQEQDLLADYLAETQKLWRPRPEFPLLMAMAGVRRLSWRNVKSDTYPAKAEYDWKAYRPTKGNPATLSLADFERLECAFAWADGLADHFAQIYRSGMIFNFAAASLSVLLALCGFLWPTEKPWLILSELILVALLILNTKIGTRRQWHRRWLDYRYLAEQLRTMRSLKLFSLSSPRFGGIDGSHERQRWTEFYANAIWRDLGAPPLIADDAALGALAEHVAQHDLDEQIAYNRVNAHRLHTFDHRLHRLGGALFLLTAAIGAVMLAGLLFHSTLIHGWIKPLSVLSAALPTIGSAVFGIRGAGDFAGAASRSARTADRLAEIAQRLRRAPLGLSDAARAAEEAAAIMQRDVGEWHSAYQSKVLAIPA